MRPKRCSTPCRTSRASCSRAWSTPRPAWSWPRAKTRTISAWPLLRELRRMSQTSRFTRARQLTSTVLQGWRPDGYADQVTGRLRRIAAARSTGMLPFSGRSDGSIYFRDGKVAYAESTRTPGPARHDQPGQDKPPLNKITAILAITEPTVDAALELLSVQSRYAKFRPSRVPDTGPASDISLDALLAEVARRPRVLGQLSVVLTADTA